MENKEVVYFDEERIKFLIKFLEIFGPGYDLIYTKVRDVKSPIRAHYNDGGIDFYVPDDFEQIVLAPHEDINIPSGIKTVVPDGWALIFFNKSGKATKDKFMVGACVVDSGYRGEVHLHVFNNGNETRTINPGDKVVQGILLPVSMCGTKEITNEEYEEFCNTERGEGGFGSTGTK